MRLLLAWLCLAIPGLSQPLTVAVEGGVRLGGDAGDPRIYDPHVDPSNSKPYLVGPAIEVRLPWRFALEAGALYSRLGNTLYIPLIANESLIRTVANSWEFPLLVKYRLPARGVHPHVIAGVAPRRAGGTTNVIHYGYYPGDVTFSSAGWHARDHAFVGGAGVEVKLWRLRIAPEIRYLRWAIPASPSPWNTAYYLRVPQNEAQVLVGIGWPVR